MAALEAFETKLKLAILKGLYLWGFAAWVYVAAIVLNPFTSESQFGPLSVYIPIPTNLFGDSAFAISFVAFILYEAWK